MAERQISCPNCGAVTELANPGITMFVCQACGSVVYWDEQAVLAAGTQAILAEPASPLRVGAQGTLLGKPFRALGRLRYAYGRGVWDEWALEFANGAIRWVTDDDGELTVEEELGPVPEAGPVSRFGPGRQFTLGGKVYVVEEMGKARCQGAEGQLPRTVLPGETYPFADGASQDGAAVISLEFDRPDGTATGFLGAPLAPGSLIVKDAAELPVADAQAGKSIPCPSCGAPLPPAKMANTKMVTCEYCGSQIELGATQQKVLGKNRQQVSFQFAIGDKAKIGPTVFEVMGRMVYSQTEEGIRYESREYFLYADGHNPRWLGEEGGHFTLMHRSSRRPAVPPSLVKPKARVKIGGKVYQKYESGRLRLDYVDGALPWVAVVGDAVEYTDLIAPPLIFSVEESDGEIEYFEGRSISRQEVFAAFGKTDASQPGVLGVGAAQQFSQSAGQRWTVWFLLAAGLLNVVLPIVLRPVIGTKRALEQSFTSLEYQGEALSREFTVTRAPSVVKLTFSAPLNNSWLAVQAAFVNQDDEVLLEAEAEAAYYHGVEGGESWSEGSRSDATVVRVESAGTYKLLIHADGGTGETGPSGNEQLTVHVDINYVPYRYHLILAFLLLVYPVKEFFRRRSFEASRWAPVTGDDDD